MIKRNILIDANNLFHRSFAVHVLSKHPELQLTNVSGYPTGLIYGVYSMLQDWIGSIDRPTRIIFFMDGIPKRRLDMDKDYKSNRRSKEGEPERPRPGKQEASITLCDGFEAKNELDVIFHIGSRLGIDLYFNKFEEADDLIASFVKQNPDDVHIIISSDQDFFPLLAENDRVVMYTPYISGNRFVDAEGAADRLEKKYKVRIPASNVPMFKALTGDTSDGIVGVPRLRKKIAAPLFHLTTIDEIIGSGMPGFSKKEKESTINLKERLELNLKLVKLITDLDIEPHLIKSDIDFSIAKQILTEDLNIQSISPFSFETVSERKMRTTEPQIPDWLSDI